MDKDYIRLRAAWNRVAAERKVRKLPKLLQKSLARQYGVTEGLVGHYRNGREPIPIKWKLRFAEYLELPILEIWPDFPHKKLLHADLDRDILEVALEYAEVEDEDQKKAVRAMISALPKRKAPKRGTI